jgi:hypothetical protein
MTGDGVVLGQRARRHGNVVRDDEAPETLAVLEDEPSDFLAYFPMVCWRRYEAAERRGRRNCSWDAERRCSAADDGVICVDLWRVMKREKRGPSPKIPRIRVAQMAYTSTLARGDATSV